ncbi:tail protein X [Acinetobacter nectaris]|uniref:tail protein X n=1 Tax=Acinetobacter nectaris TaxID=1219382 RepID=UPI001F1FB644|nr:tail protein X [Acinetobacter nectaris]MCF9034722.1 tail protein X [Acinetobacter nectaris]
MKTVKSIQNDTIDSICWRYYGRSSGVVEMVLQANPQLAELDPILPIATDVVLPDISTPQKTETTINLWD